MVFRTRSNLPEMRMVVVRVTVGRDALRYSTDTVISAPPRRAYKTRRVLNIVELFLSSILLPLHSLGAFVCYGRSIQGNSHFLRGNSEL